jgi:hypothetical protein
MHSSRWIQVMAALSLAFSLTAQACRADDFRLLEIGGLHVKWGAAALGQGAGTVTYGFVRSPLSVPGARNCPTLIPADGIAAAADVDRRRFEGLAAEAFELWSGAANIAFRPARAGETPDILIGAQGSPNGIAFADVRNDRARAVSGVAPLAAATICLNPTVAWTDNGGVPGALDLRTVLAHEIGHAIGLDHPGPTGTLMGYRDQGDMDRLTSGDIAGVQRLYGPPAR